MNPDYKTNSESFAVGSYKILYFGLKTKKNARFTVPESRLIFFLIKEKYCVFFFFITHKAH